MKVILSRKGFDSSNGGMPSPILPDGTLLSIPIPESERNSKKDEDIKICKYSELDYEYNHNGIKKSFIEIYKDLYGPLDNEAECHLDPDLGLIKRKGIDKKCKPAFGQSDSAFSHLENQNVEKGDIFLFFGWFRETKINDNNKLEFVKDKYSDKHVIYGYLQVKQVEDVKTEEEIKKYSWHPHAHEKYFFEIDKGNKKGEGNLKKTKLNALYIPTDNTEGIEVDKPGYGVFKYNENLVLTEENCTRSKWKNIDLFNKDNFKITYHNEKNYKEDYFQSACIGQEFVIEAINGNEDELKEWVKGLLEPKCNNE